MSLDGGYFSPQSSQVGFPENNSLIAYYPVPDKIIFFIFWVLAKLTSVYQASNIIEILRHVLPALTFFYVAERISKNTICAFVLALAFGLAPFIFARGLAHIAVGWVFMIPLQVYVLQKVSQLDNEEYRNEKYFFYVVSVFSSLNNPYYFLMYAQILLFILIWSLVQKKYQVSRTILYGLGISLIAFVLANMKFIQTTTLGLTSGFRNLPSLELYGLKLPELFLPAGYHKIELWSNIGQSLYYSQALIKGEVWGPYLGFVGIICLCFMLVHQCYRVMKYGAALLHPLSFQVLWITFFSMVGGLNLLLGVIGFQYLRATNRFSIWILAIVLLYVCSFVRTTKLNKSSQVIAAVLVVSAIFLDLPKEISYAQRAEIARAIESDRQFVREIETALDTPKAVILPAMVYPENGPVHGILDYDPMRLFLNSQSLKISYGEPKFAGERFVDRLNPANFSAIDLNIISKLGYNVLIIIKPGIPTNNYNSLVKLLNSMELSLLTENERYIAYRVREAYGLKPLRQNLTDIRYLSGWSAQENSWRWAISTEPKLAIAVHSDCSGAKLSGYLQSYGVVRDIKILSNGQTLWTGIIAGDKTAFQVKINQSGLQFIEFHASGQPLKPLRDNRRLTISLHDPKVSCIESNPK
jgi:hypothetical protein